MKEQQTFVLWQRNIADGTYKRDISSNLDELNELLKQGWHVHSSCPMPNGSNMGFCTRKRSITLIMCAKRRLNGFADI